jgi:hypothetical protein
MPAIPEGHRPRGAADPARTPHPELDRDNAPPPDGRARKAFVSMSVLRNATSKIATSQDFMTQ